MRHRLLRELPEQGATISQLSRQARTNKGNVSHHIRVLLAAGLVQLGPTRTVRGGTERYYLPVARRLLFPSGDDGAATRAMLATVADEIPQAGDHLLNSRRLRLTAAQARHLSECLERLVDELPEAPPGAPSYGVLVAVYPRQPRPSRHPVGEQS